MKYHSPQVDLVESPYKYFQEWKYDTEVFDNLNWVAYNESINERRTSVLEENARDVANSSLDIVNWVFGIYIVFYLLNSARKWLYKK